MEDIKELEEEIDGIQIGSRNEDTLITKCNTIFITKTKPIRHTEAPDHRAFSLTQGKQYTNQQDEKKIPRYYSNNYLNINKNILTEHNAKFGIPPKNLKLPYQKRQLPIKINNLTKSLNKQLARISHSYGKVDAYKRFKENPVTQFHFNRSDYNTYMTSKANENKETFRPKLKPLMVHSNGMTKMSQSIFNMHSKWVNSVKHLKMKSG